VTGSADSSPARSAAFQSRAIRRPRPELAAIVILTVTVALGIFCATATLATHFPRDLNSEGWNAYNATAAIADPKTLYPPPQSLWFNNYPPLSYVVVGALGSVIGDAIIAGRIVSLLSALAAALAIAAAAGAMGCNRRERMLAALLFLASPWVLTKFAGVNDPQLFGQAFGCAGLALILRHPETRSAIVAGALLLAIAEFVKPLFVDQPVALLIWLGLYRRRSAVSLVAAGLLFAAIGLMATNFFFDTHLIDHLMSPRVYTLSRIPAHFGQWLVSGFPMFAATLSLFRDHRDRHGLFCAIYALVALVISLFFSGGEGVGGNPTIELSIATSLGTAVFLNRAARAGRRRWLVRALPLLSASLLSGVFLTAMFAGWDSGLPLVARLKPQAGAAHDIAEIASRRGPALCESLALCYWAGKPRQADLWSLSQSLALGVPGADRIIHRIDTRYYCVIALDRVHQRWFPDSVRKAVLGAYVKLPDAEVADLYAPKGGCGAF
jgi:hypothetical protein